VRVSGRLPDHGQSGNNRGDGAGERSAHLTPSTRSRMEGGRAWHGSAPSDRPLHRPSSTPVRRDTWHAHRIAPDSFTALAAVTRRSRHPRHQAGERVRDQPGRKSSCSIRTREPDAARSRPARLRRRTGRRGVGTTKLHRAASGSAPRAGRSAQRTCSARRVMYEMVAGIRRSPPRRQRESDHKRAREVRRRSKAGGRRQSAASIVWSESCSQRLPAAGIRRMLTSRKPWGRGATSAACRRPRDTLVAPFRCAGIRPDSVDKSARMY